MRGGPTLIPPDIAVDRHRHRDTDGPGCEPFAEKGARPALTPPLKGARAAVTLLKGVRPVHACGKDPVAATLGDRGSS